MAALPLGNNDVLFKILSGLKSKGASTMHIKD